MYDDEYPKAIVCKCGHVAENHLWELQRTSEGAIAKPINLNAENFVEGYAIANCWSELDLEGRRCLCPILDLEFAQDWKNLADRMKRRVENTVKYRVKRMGVEP